MSQHFNITNELIRLRSKSRSGGEALIQQTRHILKKNLFSGQNVLQNLTLYNAAFGLADEELLDKEKIFSLSDIRQISVVYRLKFLDAKYYKLEIPVRAILLLEHLKVESQSSVKILAPAEAFTHKTNKAEALLFVLTNYDNYYLIHSWGEKLKIQRKYFYWPLRNFETLVISVLLYTLIVTLSLPTWLITLDSRAEYWSGYRAAAFLHLFIFHMGFTAFITFTFAKNFSSSIWNNIKDFD
jgi:hypothetical protein